METKDRWWLGSASLSGEEYPYLLRKLEYWGTTFNNASLTTKASQLRLPLSRSSSPTLSLRNWSNLCILSRDDHDTIEIFERKTWGLFRKSLRFEGDPKEDLFVFNFESERFRSRSSLQFLFSFFFSSPSDRSFDRRKGKKLFSHHEKYVIRFRVRLSARFTAIHSHSGHVGIYIAGHR